MTFPGQAHGNEPDDQDDDIQWCEICDRQLTESCEPVPCDGCGEYGCTVCIKPWDDVMGDLCYECRKRA